jgi:hypothetical protein
VLWINPITDKVPLHAWLLGTGAIQPHWPLGVAALPAPGQQRPDRRFKPRGER